MAVRYGAMPFDEAIAFFRQKNKVPAEAWDDIWQNAHNRSFMVAGATKKDLIADFYHAVNKAISEGKSLNWFKTCSGPVLERRSASGRAEGEVKDEAVQRDGRLTRRRHRARADPAVDANPGSRVFGPR